MQEGAEGATALRTNPYKEDDENQLLNVPVEG